MLPTGLGGLGLRRRIEYGLLLLLGVSGLGCLDFEKETMVFFFPRDVPEVRALLIYEGIGVTNDGADDLKKAREQFTRLVEHEQEFGLGANWLLYFCLIPEESDAPETKRFKAMLRVQLVIANGALYRNKEGKLCGYQTLTIRDGRKFIDDLNNYLAPHLGHLAAEMLDNPDKRSDVLDEQTWRLIQKAANGRFPWLEIEPGRFSFSMPATPHAVRNIKRQFFLAELQDLRDTIARLGGAPAGQPDDRTPEQRRENLLRQIDELTQAAQALVDLPLSFDHGHDRFTISLGVGNNQPVTVTTPPRGAVKHEKGVLEWARALKVSFREDLTTEKLVETFVKENGTLRRP
jgi:hypothetical protein